MSLRMGSPWAFLPPSAGASRSFASSNSVVMASRRKPATPRSSQKRIAANMACSTRGLRQGRRSEEHTSELQSHHDLVCRLLLEKKKIRMKHVKISINASAWSESFCNSSPSFSGGRSDTMFPILPVLPGHESYLSLPHQYGCHFC